MRSTVFEAAGRGGDPGLRRLGVLVGRRLLGATASATLADGFLAAVRANRDVDGIYACLHGSMVADDEDDPEGYLLDGDAQDRRRGRSRSSSRSTSTAS